MSDSFDSSVRWNLLSIVLSFILFGAFIVFSFTGIYVPIIQVMIRIIGAVGMGLIFGYMLQVFAFLVACETNEDSAAFIKAFCTKIEQGIYIIVVLELALLIIGTFL